MAEATQAQVAEAWLGILIERFRNNQKKYKIHETGELSASMRGLVEQLAGGNVAKINFFYAWYGQMVDMGVGRGTKFGQDQKSQSVEKKLLGKIRGTVRQPKPWYNKAMAAEVKRLGEILGVHTANQAVKNVADSIDKQLTIQL